MTLISTHDRRVFSPFLMTCTFASVQHRVERLGKDALEIQLGIGILVDFTHHRTATPHRCTHKG